MEQLGPMAPVIPKRAWAVLALTSVGVFVVFLDTTVVNIAYRSISTSFDSAGPAQLTWVLTAYSIVFAALLIVSGRLADQYGRKRFFLTGLGVFGVSSLACALAPGIGWLIAARVVQAAGAALILPASLGLLVPEFPPQRRGMAIGVWGSMGGVAAAIGPTIGALLVEASNWRLVFTVNVPVCALAMLAAHRWLRETPRVPGRTPDPIGVVVISGACALAALGISQGGEWGWTDARTIGALVMAALAIPLFVARAARHPAPVIPLSLFRVRSFSASGASTLFIGFTFFATLLANTLFLVSVWGYSLLGAAVALIPGPATAASLSGLSGRLADRFGYRALIVPGALLLGAGPAWQALTVEVEPAYWSSWFPATVVFGIGVALSLPNLGGAAVAGVEPARLAVATATTQTARQFGGAIGLSTVGALLAAGAVDALVPFQRAWVIVAVSAVVAAGCAWFIGDTRLRASAAAAAVPAPVPT